MQNTCMHKVWDYAERELKSHSREKSKSPGWGNRRKVIACQWLWIIIQLCVSRLVCALCASWAMAHQQKSPQSFVVIVVDVVLFGVRFYAKLENRALHCCWETSTGDIVVSKHRKAIKLAAGETCGNCVASNKSERESEKVMQTLCVIRHWMREFELKKN